MPGLVRKLLIFAAIDGLVLQPAPPRNHKPATEQAIKLAYGSNAIAPLLKDRREEDTSPDALEAHGVVGLLKVASASFLISISRREQVAVIRGKPVYCISEVALIPLSSQGDAAEAIRRARESQQRHAKKEANEDEMLSSSSEDEAEDDISIPDAHSTTSSPPPESAREAPKTKVAEDVIGKKGVYGRFAQRWFSKAGWASESRRTQGMSSEENLAKAVSDESAAAQVDASEAAPVKQSVSNEAPEEVAHVVQPKQPENAFILYRTAYEKQVSKQNSEIPLLPKLLTVTKLFFSSKNFYFSYEYNLSKTFAQQGNQNSSVPLYRAYDSLFFWNQHLISPFIEAGQDSFVLPLIQGFIGQRGFSVDTTPSDANSIIDVHNSDGAIALQQLTPSSEEPEPNLTQQQKEVKENPNVANFFLTLISRRSVKRPGLRYLRRGVDDEGNAANSVETEQILSSLTSDSKDAKTYSFVQYRGSIPLFFSQSPYSLKPIPVFRGSFEQNAAAFKLHFQHLASRYGQIQVASLVEKHNTEGKLGEAFEKHANALNESGGIDGHGAQLGFEWFDFHAVCRGMKFENVSLLFDTLRSRLSAFGYTVVEADRVIQTQSGVLRTNCMDCLDRTNVVQSACARDALEQQLTAQGVSIDLHHDPRTAWFNALWADNGDAVSRQYAGTAALKGDFTRTRKRNLTGALTDFGLTLTRYYNNLVNDYFAQAAIDFLLGRVDASIFQDFEADMRAQDYAVDLRTVRQNAIATCGKICVADAREEVRDGWSLRAPAKAGTLRSLPFDECVVLLTGQALYACSMDWATEKVRSFERIALADVEGVQKGVYITSTLAGREMDEERNVGFLVRYRGGGGGLTRVNTRSLGNEDEVGGEGKEPKKTDGVKFLAFKALPKRSSFLGPEREGEDPLNEAEVVSSICEQITRAVNEAKVGVKLLTVEEADIISLADARRSTGYLEQIGHSLKKLVW
ncbi:SacI domain-containing protein, partial [Trichodelitschia bisporula]